VTREEVEDLEKAEEASGEVNDEGSEKAS